MPSHSTITDPHLHEPKGISTALEGMIYVADGGASGTWRYWPLGKAYYRHSLTGQIINTTPSKLQINGLGTSTRTGNLPREIRGSGQLWDAANNQITPIRLNDGYGVRIDIPVTAETGSPATFKAQFDAGVGTSPSAVIFENYFTTGKVVPYVISIHTSFDILTTTTLTNGVKIYGSVDVGSLTLGSPGIYIYKHTDGLL